MTATQEKPGYIRNLHEKTVPELRELLERQENILKKKKFLQSLPDKGVKVKTFTETLNKLIAEKEDNDTKAIPLVTDRNETSSLEQVDNVPKIAMMRNSDRSSRDVVDLRGDNCDLDEKLSACLERVTLSTDVNETMEGEGSQHHRLSKYKYDKLNSNRNKFINSYERVIKKASERPQDRRVFKPNSTLNISKVQELPEAFRYRSQQTQKTESVSMKPASKSCPVRHKEESAVCLPDYKHDRSLLIPVEESLKLVEEQRKRHEELLTRQAAERLASRLHIRLDDYNPEGTNMNYRVPGENDTDSDDEPELVGYED